MKKVLAIVLAACLTLVIAATAFAAEGDDIGPYDDVPITIPFTKNWDDESYESMRPESISVKLYAHKDPTFSEADAVWYETATVTAQNGWKYDFELTDTEGAHPAFYKDADGVWHAYYFTLVEDSIEHYSLTDRDNPEVILTVDTGVWNRITPKSTKTYDLDLTEPTMSFIAAKETGNHLAIWTPQELSPLERQIIYDFVETHPNFPQEPITQVDFWSGYGHYTSGRGGFTITEDPARLTFDEQSDWAYWAEGNYTRSTIDEHAGSITNTYVGETVDITVTKVWDDASDQDGKRPETLDLTLDPAVEGVTLSIKKSEDGNLWTYTWSDLPKNDPSGVITYKVTEEPVEGYQAPDYGDGNTYAVDGGTITNKRTPEKTEATIKKTWNDNGNAYGTRPESLSVQLLANGDAHGNPVTLAPDGWTATVGNLPKYDKGDEIEYTWSEVNLPAGYVAGEPSTEGTVTTLTNTYSPEPCTAAIPAKKVLDVPEGSEAPADAEWTFSLTPAVEGDPTPEVTEYTVKPDQTVSFGDITFEHPGTFVYMVTETGSVPDVINDEETTKLATVTVSDNDKDGKLEAVVNPEDGITFTNTYDPKPEPTVDITVVKAWYDAGNLDGIRPSSVTVNVLANGDIAADPLVLNEDNGWSGVWEGLPERDGDSKITYTVEEEMVAPVTGVDGEGTYASEVKDDGKGTFTVINTHTPEEPNTDPETDPGYTPDHEPDNPNGPDDSDDGKKRSKAKILPKAADDAPLLPFALTLAASIAVIGLVAIRRFAPAKRGRR